jgi:hypothetical protein
MFFHLKIIRILLGFTFKKRWLCFPVSVASEMHFVYILKCSNGD